VAELLLAHKADVNAKGKWNITPLYLAAGSGHKEVVELLLANKADVNARDSYEGMTPLHCAAAFGHKNVAELLLTNNADVNATNKVGNTPLRLAEMEQAKVKTKKPVSPNGEKDLIDVAEFLRQHGGHE
jgi:cytohesin